MKQTEASKIAKELRSAGYSWATITNHLTERGLKKFNGEPYTVGGIWSLVNPDRVKETTALRKRREGKPEVKARADRKRKVDSEPLRFLHSTENFLDLINTVVAQDIPDDLKFRIIRAVFNK